MKKEKTENAPVTLMCPNLRCRKVLMVPSLARGKRVRCIYCNTTLLVPKEKQRLFTRSEPKEKVPSADTTGTSND